MKTKLSEKLRVRRKEAVQVAGQAGAETSMQMIHSHALTNPNSAQRLDNPEDRALSYEDYGRRDRREVYKQELKNLAKHGTRTEGKTVFMAHPVQTLDFINRKTRAALLERQDAIGTKLIKERRDTPGITAQNIAIREMIKAKRYNRVLKKLGKGGKILGLGVSLAEKVLK